MRLLEQHNIPYEVFEFSDTVHSAEEVAAIVGVPLQHVHKTLVVLPDDKTAKNRPLLVLVAAGRQLDLKKMALQPYLHPDATRPRLCRYFRLHRSQVQSSRSPLSFGVSLSN